MTMDILNEMIAHPEFGPASVAFLLRGFAETCRFTIMRNVMANLASRPFISFCRYEKQALQRNLHIGDFYDRISRNFMMGVQQPELAMAYIAEAMTRENTRADSIITAEDTLWAMKLQTITDRQFRTSTVYDEDGDVFEFANKTRDLQYQSVGVANLGSFGRAVQLYAAPWFRQRANTPKEKCEQTLMMAVTLAKAFAFLIPQSTERGRLDPNYLSVATLDLNGKEGQWNVQFLHKVIRDTRCGHWFAADDDATLLQPWAANWIAFDNAQPAATKQTIRENLENMRNCDDPLPAQTQRVYGKRGYNTSPRALPGWRNVCPLESYYFSERAAAAPPRAPPALPPTGEVVVAARTVGMIMEVFKPTAHIKAEIRAFKSQHTDSLPRYYSEIGMLTGLSSDDVQMMFDPAETAWNFHEATINGGPEPAKKFQLLRAAYRAKTPIATLRAAPAAPAAPGGAPPRAGAVPGQIADAGFGGLGAFPRFQSGRLNALLGKLPTASFKSVLALAPQLDALSARGTPTAVHVDGALDIISNRVKTHYESNRHASVDHIVADLLTHLPGNLAQIDGKVVDTMATTFSKAADLAAKATITADYATAWPEATAWRAHLASAPREALAGAPLGAPLHIGGARAGVDGAVDFTGSNDDFADMGISPSRIRALLRETSNMPSDELFILMRILTTPATAANIARLAENGFGMVGGRLEMHSMRFVTTSILILRAGGSTVRTHLSPMMVDYGAYSEQQRTSITASFHMGNEFVDWRGISALECFHPYRTMGGMRDILFTEAQQIRDLFKQSAPWSEGNNQVPAETMFLLRPATENQDDWPQYPHTDPPPPTNMMATRDTIFRRVSTCHAVLSRILGGPAQTAMVHQNMLDRILTRRHFDPIVAPAVERAASYYYSPDNTMGSKWCRPKEGSGPIGKMHMNTANVAALVYNAQPGYHFPAPDTAPAFINV
jgi:hypothetical protein